MASEMQVAMEKWTQDFQSYVDEAVQKLHADLQDRFHQVELRERALNVRERDLEDRERKIESREKGKKKSGADVASPVRSRTPTSSHTPTHTPIHTPTRTATQVPTPLGTATVYRPQHLSADKQPSQTKLQGGYLSARKAQAASDELLTPTLSNTQLNGDQGDGQTQARNCLAPGSASKIRDMFEQRAASAKQQNTSSLSGSKSKLRRPSTGARERRVSPSSTDGRVSASNNTDGHVSASNSTDGRMSASNSTDGPVRKSMADLIKVEGKSQP